MPVVVALHVATAVVALLVATTVATTTRPGPGGGEPVRDLRRVPTGLMPPKGETNKARSERHRKAAGDIHARLAKGRRDDEWRRRTADAEDGRPQHAVWPPRAPDRQDQNQTISPLARLRTYYDHLAKLPSLVHTCPNCLQRGHDHGCKSDGSALDDTAFCWRCDRDERKFNYKNGLDLDLCAKLTEEDLTEKGDPNVDANDPENVDGNSDIGREKLVAYQKLRRKWRDLTPMEEVRVFHVPLDSSSLDVTVLLTRRR